MVAGIVMELLFASLAMWTVYLMVLLYLDHKNRKVSPQQFFLNAQHCPVDAHLGSTVTFRVLHAISNVLHDWRHHNHAVAHAP